MLSVPMMHRLQLYCECVAATAAIDLQHKTLNPTKENKQLLPTATTNQQHSSKSFKIIDWIVLCITNYTNCSHDRFRLYWCWIYTLLYIWCLSCEPF